MMRGDFLLSSLSYAVNYTIRQGGGHVYSAFGFVTP